MIDDDEGFSAVSCSDGAIFWCDMWYAIFFAIWYTFFAGCIAKTENLGVFGCIFFVLPKILEYIFDFEKSSRKIDWNLFTFTIFLVGHVYWGCCTANWRYTCTKNYV